MKHFFTAVVVVGSLALTSACSHQPTTLADELAKEDLGQAELVNTAPSQEVVSSEPLSTPAVAPSYEAPAPTKSYTKKFAKKKSKKSRKMLAKAKRRHKRRASH